MTRKVDPAGELLHDGKRGLQQPFRRRERDAIRTVSTSGYTDPSRIARDIASALQRHSAAESAPDQSATHKTSCSGSGRTPPRAERFEQIQPLYDLAAGTGSTRLLDFFIPRHARLPIDVVDTRFRSRRKLTAPKSRSSDSRPSALIEALVARLTDDERRHHVEHRRR